MSGMKEPCIYLYYVYSHSRLFAHVTCCVWYDVTCVGLAIIIVFSPVQLHVGDGVRMSFGFSHVLLIAHLNIYLHLCTHAFYVVLFLYFEVDNTFLNMYPEMELDY